MELPYHGIVDSMKTMVVCGLLGSGKTTFIQQYLKGHHGKAVVLVNDFGKAGIDGEIFASGGIESIELPSGCVCCTLKFDLIASIEKVMRDYAPDLLLIEPSGVASPSGVLEVLESLSVDPAFVVGIVDATEFAELYEAQIYGEFFEEQIRGADIILINKCDIADAETADRVRLLVERLSPGAIVYMTSHGVVSEPLSDVPQRKRSLGGDAPHLNFETVSIRLPEGHPLAMVQRLFDDLRAGRFGKVARAKALVNTDEGPRQVDLSFSMVRSAPFARPVAYSRIVIIGEGLEKEAIAAACA
ncbi:MAG: CobW family GTP-binding protein [Thermodesulfovibrionales bacterium]